MEMLAVVLRGLFGIACLTGICWLLSRNRKAIDWRLVGAGLLFQLILAALILKVPHADKPVEWISSIFVTVLNFTDAGTRFVFGFLGAGPDFWEGVNQGTGLTGFGLIFGFKVLPTVIFFSALTSVLYYLGILQAVVKGFAWLLQKSMRLSGSESLAAAANVFIGQTEAPLLVKPYIADMNNSELLCLMTGGMATIAGGVFGAYVWILGGSDPVLQAMYAKHLLTASLLSAPAAIVAAKMLLPQTEPVDHELRVNKEKLGENVFDAACQGTTQGLMLALNIGAMLITFLAFIALINYLISAVGSLTGMDGAIAELTSGAYDSLSLEFLFGILFAPVAWIIGVNPGDLLAMGQLLGVKLVANEFVAYEQLGQMLAVEGMLSPRTVIIATYALCGFANFSSMGIQIGGIAVLAPSQRGNLSRLALLSVAGGTAACLYTAAVAGMFV
ncbi:MAG TPA: nucleoside transporter C-terminal domain-containing protein [Oceanipulchritudo sp.]|nr:nucleoside transporter C-terminal domain-containing protein [Oceanipulchritudo sp.]